MCDNRIVLVGVVILKFNINALSKDEFLDCLKSIKIDAKNKHIEIDKDNFTFSVVMITTTTACNNVEAEVYDVYVIALNSDNNTIIDNLRFKEFKDGDNANSYYDFLLNKIKDSSIGDLLLYFKLV